MLDEVPRPALWLGLGGLLPFAALAVALWTAPADLADDILRVQFAYGAVVLSFVGAVHWGVGLLRPEAATWPRLGWSVAPALLGWIAQFMLPVPGLGLLMLGFWAAFLADARAVASSLMPRWYLQFRRLLSAGVVALLGATLLAVIA